MSKTALNAYFMFKGDCREAMNFYQEIFGGNVTMMTYGETDASCPDANKDKIMHAQLMGGEAEFMGADETMAEQQTDNSRVNLALSGSDEAKLSGMFEKLSAGGQVQVPLSKQVWGDTFGMLVDKYGFKWMVNIGQPR